MEKTTTKPNDEQFKIGTAILNNLRKNVESREQLGVLLVDYVLEQAATGKHFREDGIAEIPVSVTIYMSKMAIGAVSPNAQPRSQECYRSCWEVFGSRPLCFEVCRTVVQ